MFSFQAYTSEFYTFRLKYLFHRCSLVDALTFFRRTTHDPRKFCLLNIGPPTLEKRNTFEFRIKSPTQHLSIITIETIFILDWYINI